MSGVVSRRSVAAFTLGLVAGATSAAAGPALGKGRAVPSADLVTFDHPPFPFDGKVPGATPDDQDQPFLQSDPDGRRFHLAPRGGKLYEDPTYSDRRSLLFVPPRFDPRRPDAALVVFFHGNLATLQRDVAGRQGVPRQLRASGLNAALVAPQMAVDALDSNAGHFYEPGFFGTYLREAAVHLAERADGGFTADDIDRLPVVIVAYSGGYVPTAYTLAAGNERIAGVVLLDALFGEEHKFADWIARHYPRTFFVSAYSKASAPLNGELEATLRDKGLPVEASLPPKIGPGTLVFRAAPDAVHNDFVTAAWVRDPLAVILARIKIGDGS